MAQLRRNFQLINRDKPKSLRILSVIKDDAYGHGALPVAKVAVAAVKLVLTVKVTESL